jgi:hypothetical protein
VNLRCCVTGLPDGVRIFEPKLPFLVHFGMPCDDKLGLYHGRLEFILPFFNIVRPFLCIVRPFLYVYCTAILYFCGHAEIFFLHFGLRHQEKSGNPGLLETKKIWTEE